jgi:hypothetical protein
MRFLPSTLVLSIAIVAACGGGGEGPDNTPATIALTPSAAVSVQSGTTTTITARVLNRGGSPVTGAPVAWSSSDQTVATVVGGVVAGARVGTANVTASAGATGTAPITASIAVTVTPGAASQLGMRTQPIGAQIGTPLNTQPVVEIRDAAGNLVPSSGATVTATISEGGGTLVGTATVTAVGGIATFSGLAITGTAGPRSLSFASAGLAAVTSARFTITPPPTPVIVLDAETLNLGVPRFTNPAPRTIGITNGGFAPLTGMTLDAVQYDAGQPTGWLNVTLSGPTAPATLTLTFATAELVEGSYRASVRLNGPGASNTPATLTVTITVTPNYTVSFGTSSEKVRILEIGGSYGPAVSVTDPRGPVTGIQPTFISRSSSVATVGSDGVITARGEGDTWVVATSPVSGDSVFVVVPAAGNGPLLRSNVSTWLTRLGDTLSGTIFLDARSATVGAAAVAVLFQPLAGAVTLTFSTPTGPPAPIVTVMSASQTNTTVVRVSIGSATGMTGSIPLVNFKLVSRVVGTNGIIAINGLDLSGVDARSLTGATSSTRIPFIIR